MENPIRSVSRNNRPINHIYNGYRRTLSIARAVVSGLCFLSRIPVSNCKREALFQLRHIEDKEAIDEQQSCRVV